jgi:hypothetical protein
VAVDGVVTNIRYDLIIWKAVNPKYDDFSGLTSATFKGRVWSSVDSLTAVYERDGLMEFSHTVESPLEPNTDYAWSIRARFEVNGQTRASEWSLVLMPDPYSSPERGCQEASVTAQILLTRGQRCYFAGSSRAYARATGQLPPYALFYFHTPGR